MTKQYQKKPVVIEALQFTGSNYTEIMMFVGKDLPRSRPPAQMEKDMDIPNEAYSITIPTLEGNMLCIKGDYVIKGVKGEFYPCKPDIFEMSYSETQEGGEQ